jgi:hypothetical protein
MGPTDASCGSRLPPVALGVAAVRAVGEAVEQLANGETVGGFGRRELGVHSHGLVDVGKTNEVGAGERTADLLHLAARDQIAQVDGEEARVLEQGAHLGLRLQVVA